MITVALVLLLIICLVFYRSAQSSQEAQDKANQLTAALQKGRCARGAIAGADSPSPR